MAEFARRLKFAQRKSDDIVQLVQAEDELKQKLIKESQANRQRLEELGREFEQLQKGEDFAAPSGT